MIEQLLKTALPKLLEGKQAKLNEFILAAKKEGFKFVATLDPETQLFKLWKVSDEKKELVFQHKTDDLSGFINQFILKEK
jgi:hypothetical protein